MSNVCYYETCVMKSHMPRSERVSVISDCLGCYCKLLISMYVFAGQTIERDTDTCCQRGRCDTATGSCRQRAARKLSEMSPKCVITYFRCCSDSTFRRNVTCMGRYLFIYMFFSRLILFSAFPCYLVFCIGLKYFPLRDKIHID